ncbi:hypothetical protein SETIT_6G112300v2 [Setaria italica]|uniref:CCHC-type domain-containing protein n=1 Tax=Setaria italica TaxID=4555 RepID=A0A368RKT1_SETIT|nr:hypothetical protein SETIT_6G112300v2 [Setaria italica]
MAEQAQDYFHNAQVVRVITSSLCAQEFNKVCSVEIAKVIWDTLKEAHEGTDQVREVKMDLIHGELEHFVMLDEETVTQMFDRLNTDMSDIAKSLSLKMNKSVPLNASSSIMVESSSKTLKKFMKKKNFKKGGDDRKKTSQRRCYECKEVGYYIADCPYKKNKDKEEKRYKEKRKDYKKKYQGQAHVGHEWDSSNENSNKECMATLAILKSPTPTKLFNNTSNNEDDTPFCLMERGTKKGYKEIKNLMEKLEKKKEFLDRQEDLFILEKERNLALEKALTEEKVKVEKLAIDLSLANDSNERMSKKHTLANESLTSLKATHSEFQESSSCLTTNLDSNVSTSEGCSTCYKIDVNACIADIAKLKESIQARDVQIKRLNMLVAQGYEGSVKPRPKIKYKAGRHPSHMDRLGHCKGSKVND